MKKINVTIYSINIDLSEEDFNKNRVYYYKYIYWSSDRVVYFHWTEKKTSYSYLLVLDNKLIINDNTFIFNLCEGRKKSFPNLEKVGEFTLLIPSLKLLNGLYEEHLGKFVTCSGLGMGSFGLNLFDIEEENGVDMLLEKLALYIITECT